MSNCQCLPYAGLEGGPSRCDSCHQDAEVARLRKDLDEARALLRESVDEILRLRDIFLPDYVGKIGEPVVPKAAIAFLGDDDE